MSYWNPGNKAVLYFHYCGFGGGSVYLKVNVVSQQVVAVCEKPHDRQGKRLIIGVYSIKWVTFMGNYIHYAKAWGTRQRSLDGTKISCILKLTTRNQYEKARENVLNLLS